MSRWLVLLIVALGWAGRAEEAEGWDNRCPTRTLRPRVRVFWEADWQSDPTGFSLERCDGAEGEAAVEDGRLVIRKTNARGYLVVTATRGFSRPVGSKLKIFADAEVSGADPNYSLAFPRIVSRQRMLHSTWELDAVNVFMGGGEKNAYLANTAPGVAERRFAHRVVSAADGDELWPALVVAGAPSVTKWHRWGVQDYAAAHDAWVKVRNPMNPDGSLKRQQESEADFAARLAADCDHTAKVVAKDGRVRLVVDGCDDVPVIYKNPCSWNQKWGDYDGRAFAREGIRLQAFSIGNAPHWTTNGEWNVEATVRDIREQMRVSPEALTVLSFGMANSREYAERHPDEIWRDPDGTPCQGLWSHMYQPHYTAKTREPTRPGCWPWISHSSKVYCEYMKRTITRIAEALRREGLAKRVVGIHFCGYHDGQFAPFRADFSKPVREGFREFLTREYGSAPANLTLPVPDDAAFFSPTNRLAYDFNRYLHVAPFRFQEAVARQAKKAFAKDIVTLHWCMGTYGGEMNGAYYFDTFFTSDAMDALVAQPSYIRRLPGCSTGVLQSLASFTRHGKLYLDELDLRAWGSIPGYVNEESLGGLGFAMDLPEWQAVNRKMVGRMIAADQGYWYYDISGGFYNPDEIERDIGAAVRTYRDWRARAKPAAWRPSAAVVVDAEGLLWQNLIGVPYRAGSLTLIDTQLEMLAASGAPFENWTYRDAAADPCAMDSAKVVVLAGFFHFDAARRDFLARLVNAGKTVVLLAGTDGFRAKERPGGLSPEIRAVEPTRELEFMSRHQCDWYRWNLGVEGGPLAALHRPPSFAFAEREGTEVLARYVQGGEPAVIRRGRIFAFGQTGALTPRFFNRLVREAGGYVAVTQGLQVDMNAGFMSTCALDTGRFDVRLPFACRVRNLKTRTVVAERADRLALDMSAGEVRWFALEP